MFLVNSCLGHFSAADRSRLPLFRSYGVNLPSSLTTLLPLVLGFSPRLPVSVCGTGALVYARAFLVSRHRLLHYFNFVPFRPCLPSHGLTYPKASLMFKCRRLRNLYRMCIDYASRPRLSSRLTQGGRAFPWNPWTFGHRDSRAILATHSGILTPVQSTSPFDDASPRTRRSPTNTAYS